MRRIKYIYHNIRLLNRLWHHPVAVEEKPQQPDLLLPSRAFFLSLRREMTVLRAEMENGDDIASLHVQYALEVMERMLGTELLHPAGLECIDLRDVMWDEYSSFAGYFEGANIAVHWSPSIPLMMYMHRTTAVSIAEGLWLLALRFSREDAPISVRFMEETRTCRLVIRLKIILDPACHGDVREHVHTHALRYFLTDVDGVLELQPQGSSLLITAKIGMMKYSAAVISNRSIPRNERMIWQAANMIEQVK